MPKNFPKSIGFSAKKFLYYCIIGTDNMSSIEDIIWSAEEHGKRTDLLQRVGEIRVSNPRMTLNDVYDKAYQDVMNT